MALSGAKIMALGAEASVGLSNIKNSIEGGEKEVKNKDVEAGGDEAEGDEQNKVSSSLDDLEGGSHATFSSVLTIGGGIALALFSVAAVAITSSVVTIVSAAVGILVAPTTMVQRFELNRTGTFREVHNRLRQDVNNLAEQNEELTTEVQDLESKTQRLGGVETELQKHLKRTKHTVNSFVNLVNESEEIEKEMERIQQGDVLRHLFEAIIESDKSEDFEIEENEINRLVFKLKAVEGLNLSADAIKKCLQEMGDDRNVQDIFLAVKKLMNVEKLRIEHDQTEKDEEEQKRLKNMKIEVSTRSVV